MNIMHLISAVLQDLECVGMRWRCRILFIFLRVLTSREEWCISRTLRPLAIAQNHMGATLGPMQPFEA